MANNLAAFNSEAWSSRLVDKLDSVNVALPLVNRDWEGDLANNLTVWVRTLGSITMAPYTKGATISYNDLTPTKEAFTVSDGEYFAFQVDDIDKAQTDIGVMDAYMKRAVVSMNKLIDTKIWAAGAKAQGYQTLSAGAGSGAAGTATVSGGAVTAVGSITGGSGYTVAPIVTFTGGGGYGARGTAVLSSGAVASVTITNGGQGYATAPTVGFTPGNGVTLTSDTAATSIWSAFTRAEQLLSEANVISQSRWAVIPPSATRVLREDTAHFIRAGDMGDAIVQTGYVDGKGRTASQAPGYLGMICGFHVYESNNLPTAASGTSKVALFGDNDAISYAAQITEIEALRLQTTFADAIRGLLLHDTFVPNEASHRLVALRVLNT